MTHYARGFSTTNYHYDGIATAGTSNRYAGESELDAALYDRVAVVRGATGLLTGAGNPAASINLVRKHADGKVFTGEGRIRRRVVAAYQDADSYVKLWAGAGSYPRAEMGDVMTLDRGKVTQRGFYARRLAAAASA